LHFVFHFHFHFSSLFGLPQRLIRWGIFN